MTRENKLALVVGFGLILLVGILISDHFVGGIAVLVECVRVDRREQVATRNAASRLSLGDTR